MNIKEAIEKLKSRLEPNKYGGKCVLGYSNKYCFGVDDLQAIETVISELEKKDKRIRDYEKGIERLKKEIEKERNTNNKRVAEMVIERLGGKATERKVEKC